MSFRAYVILDSPAEKTAQMVKTLRNKPGVVSVDLLDDSAQLMMVVEATQRKKLAKLTIRAISSADSITTVMQLLITTSVKY
jgi:nitrate reductase NapAB chaperone NapD